MENSPGLQKSQRLHSRKLISWILKNMVWKRIFLSTIEILVSILVFGEVLEKKGNGSMETLTARPANSIGIMSKCARIIIRGPGIQFSEKDVKTNTRHEAPLDTRVFQQCFVEDQGKISVKEESRSYDTVLK